MDNALGTYKRLEARITKGDLDALLARLASVGWLTVGEVQTVESGERQGVRLIYVRGPDGITLEFLQRPEDAPK